MSEVLYFWRHVRTLNCCIFLCRLMAMLQLASVSFFLWFPEILYPDWVFDHLQYMCCLCGLCFLGWGVHLMLPCMVYVPFDTTFTLLFIIFSTKGSECMKRFCQLLHFECKVYRMTYLEKHTMINAMTLFFVNG